MSIVRIATNFNIDIEFTAPPFYRRLFAWVFDLIIQIFYLIIAGKIIDAINNGNTDEHNLMGWALSMLILLPCALYHVILEATMNGQSIGKKIMGIKVVSENGGRPALGQLIIRWLIRTSDYSLFIIVLLIPFAAIFGAQVYWGIAGAIGLLIADLVLVNTKQQQRLGDILGHTVLINTKQKEKITDTVFLDVSDKYVPQYPQIMQLSDRDMNALKGIIDTARKHNDHNMAIMAAEKIKAHLKIESYLEPEDFLEILLKDYNALSAN